MLRNLLMLYKEIVELNWRLFSFTGFRYRPHPCLRHGQVSLRSLVIRSDRQEYSTSGTDKTKNPAPRGTRENKEENNIIILHSNDSFIPLTYLTYTLCTTKILALISTKLSAFISEIMYLPYICRY